MIPAQLATWRQELDGLNCPNPYESLNDYRLGKFTILDEAVPFMEQLHAHNMAMRDALENIIIAIGMGWDLEGVIEVGEKTIQANDAWLKQQGKEEV